MALSEFELIRRYFSTRENTRNSTVAKGIGDDCAVLNVPSERQLLVSTDTLVEGVHFPGQASAREIAYRCVAVNVSDIVAMGGEPEWVSLALTLPLADEAWVQGFSHGFFEAAAHFGVQLIGGDTTKGPLSITLTVYGFVPYGAALLRSGASVGDGIYVSGELGGAAAALHQLKSGQALDPQFAKYFYRPQPPIALGIALREVATACLDVSDGLLADLNHLLDASGVGAELWLDTVPLGRTFEAYCHDNALDPVALACTGGDDYQLCFTMPPVFENKLLDQIKPYDIDLKKVGRVVAGGGLTCLDADDTVKIMTHSGYQHFE